jgi:hypothetical protein
MTNPQLTKPALSESSDTVDDEIAALIARAGQDPVAVQILSRMQGQGLKVLRELMDHVTRTLAALDTVKPAPPAVRNGATQLAAASRDRESAAKQRRELAQDLVIGALVNLNNPDWNPLDPSTSKDESSSAIMSLLNLQLPPNR